MLIVVSGGTGEESLVTFMSVISLHVGDVSQVRRHGVCREVDAVVLTAATPKDAQRLPDGFVKTTRGKR
jgi:hypothetical protein